MRYSSHFFAKGGLGDLRHALYSQTFDVFFKVRPKTFSIPRVRYCRRVNPTFTMSLSQIAHAPEGNSRDCKLDIHDRVTHPSDDGWWSQTESNRRHPACKAGALPAELWPLTPGVSCVSPGELGSVTSAVQGGEW